MQEHLCWFLFSNYKSIDAKATIYIWYSYLFFINITLNKPQEA